MNRPHFTSDQLKFFKLLEFDNIGKTQAKWMFNKRDKNYRDYVKVEIDNDNMINFYTMHGKYGCCFMKMSFISSARDLACAMQNLCHNDDTKDFCDFVLPKITEYLDIIQIKYCPNCKGDLCRVRNSDSKSSIFRCGTCRRKFAIRRRFNLIKELY